MLQVFAIQLLCRVERRVLSVQATGHALADDEGTASRAVVCATAVIPDAPPELGEDQDDDLIRRLVLFQVLHKRLQSTGELPYQPWVRWYLSGVRVIAA